MILDSLTPKNRSNPSFIKSIDTGCILVSGVVPFFRNLPIFWELVSSRILVECFGVPMSVR